MGHQVFGGRVRLRKTKTYIFLYFPKALGLFVIKEDQQKKQTLKCVWKNANIWTVKQIGHQHWHPWICVKCKAKHHLSLHLMASLRGPWTETRRWRHPELLCAENKNNTRYSAKTPPYNPINTHHLICMKHQNEFECPYIEILYSKNSFYTWNSSSFREASRTYVHIWSTLPGVWTRGQCKVVVVAVVVVAAAATVGP